MGILIGPLIMKDLFIFSIINVNNKLLNSKCKDRFELDINWLTDTDTKYVSIFRRIVMHL